MKKAIPVKTKTILAAVSFALTGVIAVLARGAGADDGLSVWEGTGKTYSAQGTVSSTYSLLLTRKQTGTSVRMDGTLTLANGQQVPFWEEYSNQSSAGFDIRSSKGSGHGGCFVNLICQTYKEDADGYAVAKTIVIDSADKIRLQESEYRQKQVVQYREATLTRKP